MRVPEALRALRERNSRLHKLGVSSHVEVARTIERAERGTPELTASS